MKLMYAVVAVIGSVFLLFGTKTDPFGVKYELSSLAQGQPQVVFAASGAVVDGYQASMNTQLTWIENSPVSHLIDMNDSLRADVSKAKQTCLVKNDKNVRDVEALCDTNNM